MSLLTAAIARAVRFLVPEGLIVAALLAVPALSLARLLEPYTAFLLLGAFGATLTIAWRFRRGQLLFGATLVAMALLLPLLPPALRGPGLALLTLDLALLATLPERGILSAGGALRGLALLAPLALLVPLSPVSLDLSPSLTVAVAGLPPVPLLWIAHAVALTTLAALALARSDAVPRGLFWAAAALLAAETGLFPAAGRLAGAGAEVVGTGVGAAAGAGTGVGVLVGVWPVLAALVALLVAGVEEAHRLAYHDGLTGLPSRRALDERLQRLVGRYTVAMVDVDHFKKFNDRHGHDVGDQVLRMVAARLRETPGAAAYRYGGEEFALVFRGRSVEEVREPLEAARRAVGDRPFVIRGKDRPARKPKRRLFLWRARPQLSVTVSLGAAQGSGWRQSPEQVVKAADEALYRAKKKGRNRVVA